MSGVYVDIPDSLIKEMNKHKMINWGETVSKELTMALSERAMVEETLKKGRLTHANADEIGRVIKKSLYQRHYEKD